MHNLSGLGQYRDSTLSLTDLLLSFHSARFGNKHGIFIWTADSLEAPKHLQRYRRLLRGYKQTDTEMESNAFFPDLFTALLFECGCLNAAILRCVCFAPMRWNVSLCWCIFSAVGQVRQSGSKKYSGLQSGSISFRWISFYEEVQSHLVSRHF